MHAEGLISDHHLEKLAEVQSRMMAASGKGLEAVVDVIVSEVELSDFDEYDYEKCASELEPEKTASGIGHTLRQAAGWVGRKPEAAIGLAGLGIMAGMGIHRASKAISNRKKTNQSLVDIKAQMPELKKDPDTDRYFGVISEFSPSLARNPTVAGNLIQKMKQWGAIDHKTVQDLIQMEKTHQDTNRGMSLVDASNVMSNAANVARFALPDRGMAQREREMGVQRGFKERELGLKREEARAKRRHMVRQDLAAREKQMRDQEAHWPQLQKTELEVERLRAQKRKDPWPTNPSITIKASENMVVKIMKDAILREQVIKVQRGKRISFKKPTSVEEHVKAALRNGLYAPYWMGPAKPLENGQHEETLGVLEVEKLIHQEDNRLDTEQASADNVYEAQPTGAIR
jgi:hypothetical protein